LGCNTGIPRYEDSHQQDHTHNDPTINKPTLHVFTKRYLTAAGPKPKREGDLFEPDEIIVPYDEKQEQYRNNCNMGGIKLPEL
jgi:hypothetical protein